MGKEHNNDSFEQDSQLIQEEYNERQDSEDLAETKINNQNIVDKYLETQGLPSTTNMNLSNIPTGWVLNHGKDGAKDQVGDIYYPVAPDSPSSLSLLPVLGGMTHKNSPGKAGSTKKNARSHPYAKHSSEKKQEKKQIRQAELPQSNANYSNTNGLDAEDGCFGAQSIFQ